MSKNHSKSPHQPTSSKKPRGGYTQVDNFTLDVVMPLVSSKYPKYFQTLMVIRRKTVGWGKSGDYISLTQFMKGSGASRDTVVSALAFWIQSGLIMRGPRLGYRGTAYFELAPGFDESAITSRLTRLVESFDQSNGSTSTSRTIPPPLVEPVDTQKKLELQRNYKRKESGSASPHQVSPRPKVVSDKSNYSEVPYV
jgi:hypothetical protein